MEMEISLVLFCKNYTVTSAAKRKHVNVLVLVWLFQKPAIKMVFLMFFTDYILGNLK